MILLLKSAFERCVSHDYARERIIKEEDVRACVFSYLKPTVDLCDDWRMFVDSVTIPLPEATTDARLWRPDLVFFTDSSSDSPKVEILVEIKHWPSDEKIESDLQKLRTVQARFGGTPEIVFFAIVEGPNETMAAERAKRLSAEHNAHVWLASHHRSSGVPIYAGRWCEEAKMDPFRAVLNARVFRPNKSMEPTSTSVMRPADAGRTPAVEVAHH